MKAKDLELGLYWDLTGKDGPTVVEVHDWGLDGVKEVWGLGSEESMTLRPNDDVWWLRKLEVPSLEWLMGLPE